MSRYLFNAGEGFQRFAVQHQIKLNRMTDVLLTRISTDAAGGLPGTLPHCVPPMSIEPSRKYPLVIQLSTLSCNWLHGLQECA